MTIRLLALFALLAQMGACRAGNEEATNGGHCGRTQLSAAVTVHVPDGSMLSCAAASADRGFPSPPPRTWVGKVTGSDAHSISVSVCATGAGNDDGGATDAGGIDDAAATECVPGVLQIDAVAPGLDLTQFPQVWVRVEAAVTLVWACQQSLEITTADPVDGSTSPSPSGQLLLALVDGNGIAFADSPYKVAHVQLGCAPGRTCNGGTSDADDYAFDFSRPGDSGAPARVYMGETVTWRTAGADFTIHNLRSFQTGNCDDYWNWAYTIYTDPK